LSHEQGEETGEEGGHLATRDPRCPRLFRSPRPKAEKIRAEPPGSVPAAIVDGTPQ